MYVYNILYPARADSATRVGRLDSFFIDAEPSISSYTSYSRTTVSTDSQLAGENAEAEALEYVPPVTRQAAHDDTQPVEV